MKTTLMTSRPSILWCPIKGILFNYYIIWPLPHLIWPLSHLPCTTNKRCLLFIWYFIVIPIISTQPSNTSVFLFLHGYFFILLVVIVFPWLIHLLQVYPGCNRHQSSDTIRKIGHTRYAGSGKWNRFLFGGTGGGINSRATTNRILAFAGKVEE